MRAGELRHRITIEKRTQGRDALGQPINTWETLAPLWADVRHLGGVESIRAGAVTSMVQASCRIRWRTGIDAGMRVIHNGLIYDIEAVLPGADRAYVDLVLKTTGQALEDEEPPDDGGWGW